MVTQAGTLESDPDIHVRELPWAWLISFAREQVFYKGCFDKELRWLLITYAMSEVKFRRLN